MKSREFYAKVKFSAVRGHRVVDKHLNVQWIRSTVETTDTDLLCTEGC